MQFLQNFYEKSKRSILKARTEGPAAYVLTANDPRPGAQAELLRVLQKQAVEISRATAAFSVTVPVRTARQRSWWSRRAAAAGRWRRCEVQPPIQRSPPHLRRRRASSRPAQYIIRMDQPYSRIADALLDYQYWSPNDPQKKPYDDTGWTFPEGFAVQAVRVTDTTVLDVPVDARDGRRSGAGRR